MINYLSKLQVGLRKQILANYISKLYNFGMQTVVDIITIYISSSAS